MCKVGRKNKKAGLFIKKKLEDAREAKDVLVALAVTLAFCSPIDVRVIKLPRRFNKHIKVCVCVCARAQLCGQINQNALQRSVILHDVGLRFRKTGDSAHCSRATRVTVLPCAQLCVLQ